MSKLWDLYEFTPQPDITAYEVALVLAFRVGSEYRANPHNYKHKPSIWTPAGTPFNARLPDWPANMSRHYTRTLQGVPNSDLMD
jgi:hypothetical protein